MLWWIDESQIAYFILIFLRIVGVDEFWFECVLLLIIEFTFTCEFIRKIEYLSIEIMRWSRGNIFFAKRFFDEFSSWLIFGRLYFCSSQIFWVWLQKLIIQILDTIQFAGFFPCKILTLHWFFFNLHFVLDNWWPCSQNRWDCRKNCTYSLNQLLSIAKFQNKII